VLNPNAEFVENKPEVPIPHERGKNNRMNRQNVFGTLKALNMMGCLQLDLSF
jgi:hypothetical protein